MWFRQVYDDKDWTTEDSSLEEEVLEKSPIKNVNKDSFNKDPLETLKTRKIRLDSLKTLGKNTS